MPSVGAGLWSAQERTAAPCIPGIQVSGNRCATVSTFIVPGKAGGYGPGALVAYKHSPGLSLRSGWREPVPLVTGIGETVQHAGHRTKGLSKIFPQGNIRARNQPPTEREISLFYGFYGAAAWSMIPLFLG